MHNFKASESYCVSKLNFFTLLLLLLLLIIYCVVGMVFLFVFIKNCRNFTFSYVHLIKWSEKLYEPAAADNEDDECGNSEDKGAVDPRLCK